MLNYCSQKSSLLFEMSLRETFIPKSGGRRIPDSWWIFVSGFLFNLRLNLVYRPQKANNILGLDLQPLWVILVETIKAFLRRPHHETFKKKFSRTLGNWDQHFAPAGIDDFLLCNSERDKVDG